MIDYPPIVVGQRVPGEPGAVKFEPSPNEEIIRLQNLHEGKTLCIVANGESVRKVNLGKINCLTLGVNRAWDLPRQFTYYCMGDKKQLEDFRGSKMGKLAYKGWFFTTHMGPEYATRIRGLPMLDHRRFSFDLTVGVYLNNTITAFALQLAVYMGFARIYLLGVDCKGSHFYGGAPIPEEKFANQREALGFIAGVLHAARPDIEILNLNMNSACFAFPRARFESVFS